MYTLTSIVIVAATLYAANRGNKKDRDRYDFDPGDASQLLLLHIRQDLKLVVFLLAALIVLFGLSIDRTLM